MKNIASLLFFVLLLTSCGKTETQTPGVSAGEPETTIFLTKAQFENAGMEFGKIEEKPFVKTIQTTGKIEVPPKNHAVISAFMGGYIKDTPLLVGDEVKKGQRLVTLENPEFISLQQQYLEISEQLTFLNSEYERQKTMLEENITSQKSFLKAESEYKSSRALHSSLKKRLEMLNINPRSVEAGNIVSEVHIYSPISGSVSKIFINTGSYVSSADKIMEIINTDQLFLELKAFERDLFSLKKNQEILFSIPEASKEVFKGHLHLVGSSVDPVSRMATLHGLIDEKETGFSVGMFVEAAIVTDSENRQALPEDAIVELEGIYYVLKLVQETSDSFELEREEVKTGMTFNGFTVLENTNLDTNSRYLTKGSYVLIQDEHEDDFGH